MYRHTRVEFNDDIAELHNSQRQKINRPHVTPFLLASQTLPNSIGTPTLTRLRHRHFRRQRQPGGPIVDVGDATALTFGRQFGRWGYSQQARRRPMSNAPPTSPEKALSLLSEIILSGDTRTLPEIARDLGIPVPTAYRMVAALQNQGFLIRIQRRHYVAGPALQAIVGQCSQREIIRNIARPILDTLSRRLGTVCHMGTWDNDMVTYLLKCSAKGDTIFTREGMQLEGYCSGLGRALLSTLDRRSLRKYLAIGEFVKLTKNTITDPVKLGDEVERVREKGYAVDAGEVDENLFCLAISIETNHDVRLAISSSYYGRQENISGLVRELDELRKAATSIAETIATVFPDNASRSRPSL